MKQKIIFNLFFLLILVFFTACQPSQHQRNWPPLAGKAFIIPGTLSIEAQNNTTELYKHILTIYNDSDPVFWQPILEKILKKLTKNKQNPSIALFSFTDISHSPLWEDILKISIEAGILRQNILLFDSSEKTLDPKAIHLYIQQ